MPSTSQLSDKALAVFAFAAFHQLESGQPVKSVILSDGKGHKADAEAVAELQAQGLASTSDNDIVFSEDGLRVLANAVDGLKSSARGA